MADQWPFYPTYPYPYPAPWPTPRSQVPTPITVPGNAVRTLSPSDFGAPPAQPGSLATQPIPASPTISTSALLDDTRVAAVVAVLKLERARLQSNDPAVVADAERKIALQAGYLAAILEAHGITTPANVFFHAPATLGEAVDNLIQALENKTRIYPLLAGVLLGFMACKIITCS
jgi:hypothetical protein